MRTLAKAAALLIVGTLLIIFVYLEAPWAIHGTRWLLLAGLLLCGIGLALATYAIGFARAGRKYASRLSSLAADVEEKRRELKDLSEELEKGRKKLAVARKEVAAAKNELTAKKKQLAVISGKLGDKEKRLKKIRRVVGT